MKARAARRALAALALVTAGCAAGPPSTVLLISLDTLRADHLGAYGYPRPTSPTLDALAREGVVFEDASSPSPWTLPAHGSLLTGRYPRRHGLVAHTRSLPEQVPTLAELLAARGRASAAAVNSFYLVWKFGLHRGFGEFAYEQEFEAQREPTRAITDSAIAWLAGPDRPTFVFLHYYDVHSDYRSLPRYEQAFARPYPGTADGSTSQLMEVREGGRAIDARDAAHLIDLYDAGIRQIDDELARLVRFLREEGLLDRCLLVVTSDHGEEFLEHGGVLHGRTHYQEVLRVPLILRGPGIPAARVATPVSLVDVAPTILAQLGVPAPADLDGTDLTPLWRGGAPAERPLYAEADHYNHEHGILRSVRLGRHKLIEDRIAGRTQLFDLADDPDERRDLSAQRPELRARLLAQLLAFAAEDAVSAPASAPSRAQRERLQRLGYVDGPADPLESADRAGERRGTE